MTLVNLSLKVPLRDSRHPGITEPRLVRRENYVGSHTFLTKQGHGSPSPDEGSAHFRGHLRDNTNMKDGTHHPRTHSFQQGEYERMIMTAD